MRDQKDKLSILPQAVMMNTLESQSHQWALGGVSGNCMSSVKAPLKSYLTLVTAFIFSLPVTLSPLIIYFVFLYYLFIV